MISQKMHFIRLRLLQQSVIHSSSSNQNKLEFNLYKLLGLSKSFSIFSLLIFCLVNSSISFLESQFQKNKRVVLPDIVHTVRISPQSSIYAPTRMVCIHTVYMQLKIILHFVTLDDRITCSLRFANFFSSEENRRRRCAIINVLYVLLNVCVCLLPKCNIKVDLTRDVEKPKTFLSCNLFNASLLWR